MTVAAEFLSWPAPIHSDAVIAVRRAWRSV